MTLKRLMAPWVKEKKTKKFVVEPRPGPHSSAECMPLGVIIRDVLGYARNMNEARVILNSGSVKVNGAVRKEKGFPVGLMDVLSMGDEHYRVTVDKKGLAFTKIKTNEAGVRLLRLDNKTPIAKKIMQFNFHDGTNINAASGDLKTGDVVVFDIEKKTIKETVKMEKGATALVIGGNSMGTLGRIVQVMVTRSSMPNQVVMDIGGTNIRLPRDYIFVVGKDEPTVTLTKEVKA